MSGSTYQHLFSGHHIMTDFVSLCFELATLQWTVQ